MQVYRLKEEKELATDLSLIAAILVNSSSAILLFENPLLALIFYASAFFSGPMLYLVIGRALKHQTQGETFFKYWLIVFAVGFVIMLIFAVYASIGMIALSGGQ